jgi:hypothetical protein
MVIFHSYIGLPEGNIPIMPTITTPIVLANHLNLHWNCAKKLWLSGHRNPPTITGVVKIAI